MKIYPKNYCGIKCRSKDDFRLYNYWKKKSNSVFQNFLRFPGLPVHKLEFKVGTILMLIRNLSINDGLCNGTRMKIIQLFKFNIKIEIITGTRSGNSVYISRIILDTGEFSTLPFIWYRRQFPIVLAFAMTINKSQGRSLERVGIYIHRPLFSHGQL